MLPRLSYLPKLNKYIVPRYRLVQLNMLTRTKSRQHDVASALLAMQTHVSDNEVEESESELGIARLRKKTSSRILGKKYICS